MKSMKISGLFTLALIGTYCAVATAADPEPRFLQGKIENRKTGALIRGKCTGTVAGQECDKFKIVHTYETEVERNGETVKELVTKEISAEIMTIEWPEKIRLQKEAVYRGMARTYTRTDLNGHIVIDGLFDTLTLGGDAKAWKLARQGFEAMEKLNVADPSEISPNAFKELLHQISRF